MAPTSTTVAIDIAASGIAATTQNSASQSLASATLRPTRSLIVLAAQTALQAPTLTGMPDLPSTASEHKHLSSGAIAGLATVSVVAFLSICALTIGLCVMFTNRRRARRAPSKAYLREQGRLGPETQMRTTFDPPASRPGMFELGGWQRMKDQDSTSTRTESTQSQTASGKQAASEGAGHSPSSPALFRYEQAPSAKPPSHKRRWSEKNIPNLPLSPLDDELQLTRLSEIKL